MEKKSLESAPKFSGRSGNRKHIYFFFCLIKTENEQIGGVGKEIEIDESKFGKRKYHQGKRVDGLWVFGGIKRESKKCFFEIVEDHSANTLIPIIKRNVKPGSIILSDC